MTQPLPEGILQIISPPYDIKPLSSRWGYIYLIQHSEKVFKIGRTNNPETRLRQLQSLYGQHLKMITAIEVCDVCAIETNLHHYFEDNRIENEWFYLDSEDLRHFCVYASVYEMQSRVASTVEALGDISDKDSRYRPFSIEVNGQTIDGEIHRG